MPMTATKKFDVEVGRIRENDVFGEYGLDLFVSGDQVGIIRVSGRVNIVLREWL
jgi:aspartate-semialdehyde dehydrogenase